MDDSISALSPFSLLPPTARPTRSRLQWRRFERCSPTLFLQGTRGVRTGKPLTISSRWPHAPASRSAGSSSSSTARRWSMPAWAVRPSMFACRACASWSTKPARTAWSIPPMPSELSRCPMSRRGRASGPMAHRGADPGPARRSGPEPAQGQTLLTRSCPASPSPHCGARRLSHLDMSHIQMREGRWVLADIRGKRGRVRTVALPASAKAAIDEWTRAAGITSGPVFRRLTKSGRVLPG